MKKLFDSLVEIKTLAFLNIPDHKKVLGGRLVFALR